MIGAVHEGAQVVAGHALDDEAHLALQVGAQVALADHAAQDDLVGALLHQLLEPDVQLAVGHLASVAIDGSGFRVPSRPCRPCACSAWARRRTAGLVQA